MYNINSTYDYHRFGKPDLMTELTICESFSSQGSPYSKAFGIEKPYGALLGDFLKKHGLLKSGCVIMEAGGGYGSLMKGLLENHSHLVKRVIMADLSMYMLNRQRETLQDLDGKADFIQGNIQDMAAGISGIDLIILNEMIGDLDVVRNVEPGKITVDVQKIIEKYDLEVPDVSFNFNLGAVCLIEDICKSGVAAFVSEHSSDPVIPDDMRYLGQDLEVTFPREIKLHGHSEYTIRFSHLRKIAEAWGREVKTGPLIDLLGIKGDDAMRFIFTSRACGTEKQEIVYEVLENIREYRWMLIK